MIASLNLAESVALANDMVLEGEGPTSTELAADGSFPVLSADIFQSKNVRLNGLRLNSGTRGISIEVEDVATDYNLSNCLIDNQSECGLYANQMLIIANFNQVTFDSCKKGVFVDAANTNLVNFSQCQFKELTDSAIHLRGGSEAVTVASSRFEARDGGATGGNVIALEAPKAFSVIGSYFEDSFRNILQETQSTNTVLFQSNRFSGQEGGQSETFNSDGVVTFFNNQFHVGSDGAEKMLLLGHNVGLRTQDSHVYYHNDDSRVHMRSKIFTAVSGVPEDVFTFERDGTGNADNQQCLSGTLRMTAQAKTSGGTPVFLKVSQEITVTGFADNDLHIQLGPQDLGGTYDPDSTGATLTASIKSGATATSATLIVAFAMASLGSVQIFAELDVRPMRFSPDWNQIKIVPEAE